jgi:hypothetical protein
VNNGGEREIKKIKLILKNVDVNWTKLKHDGFDIRILLTTLLLLQTNQSNWLLLISHVKQATLRQTQADWSIKLHIEFACGAPSLP